MMKSIKNQNIFFLKEVFGNNYFDKKNTYEKSFINIYSNEKKIII